MGQLEQPRGTAICMEKGPDGDTVTQGEFEYTGEGQTEDQRETLWANSILIDAITGGFPIHFFYKGSGYDG